MTLIRDVAVQPDRVAIVVTHDPRVLEFGDRIISLEDGRVKNTETTGGLFRDFTRCANSMNVSLNRASINGKSKGAQS